MRLPEAFLLGRGSNKSSQSLVALHAIAWEQLLASDAPYALIVTRGALLATTMRESIASLIADASDFRVIHLLAVVGMPHLAGTPPESMLRDAPHESPGAPAYLISRRGATLALAHHHSAAASEERYHPALMSSPAAGGSGGGDGGPALYAALGGSADGCYACSRTVAQAGEAFDDESAGGSGGAAAKAPPASDMRTLVSRLVAGGYCGAPGCENPDEQRFVAACLLALDRKLFVPRDTPPASIYKEAPLHLPHTVMSSPSAHATAAAALLPALQRIDKQRPLKRALDIGAGSGYVSALLALLIACDEEGCGAAGAVVVLEMDGELAEHARDAAASAINCTTLTRRREAAEILVAAAGDGRDGYASLAPYDAIYVGGACERVPPKLVEQLAVHGRLLLAVGEADAPQDLTLVEKLEDGTTREQVIRGGQLMYALR